MAATLDYSAKTSTSITLALTGLTPLTYPNIDIQYSTRPDFNFVPSPLYSIASTAAPMLSLLNQGSTYFVRVREKTGAGVVQPWSNVIAVFLPVGVDQITTPATIMVSPAIIVVPVPIQTWTGGAPVAGYPVTNLGTDSPNEQFWSTGTYFDIETDGSPIDTFCLMNTNWPASVVWTAKASATQAGLAAPSYTSPVTTFQVSPGLPGRPGYHGLIRLAAPQSYRWWRLQFTSGNTPPGNLWVASFFCCGLAKTAKNIAADKVETPLDYGSVERLRDGSADRRSGYRGRRVEFEIALMTEAQWETQFSDLRQRIGLTDPCLAIPNSKAGAFLHDRILYGPLATNRVDQPFAPRFTKSLAIESLI